MSIQLAIIPLLFLFPSQLVTSATQLPPPQHHETSNAPVYRRIPHHRLTPASEKSHPATAGSPPPVRIPHHRLTCDRDKLRRAHFNDVVTRDRLRVLGVRIAHQGAYAAPRRQHVPATNCDKGQTARILRRLLRRETSEEVYQCKSVLFCIICIIV